MSTMKKQPALTTGPAVPANVAPAVALVCVARDAYGEETSVVSVAISAAAGERWVAACKAHDATQPGLLAPNSSQVLWNAYWEAYAAWCNTHPAGGPGYDVYEVVQIPLIREDTKL